MLLRDLLCFFFFNDTATTEIYTLSLHDALPICRLHPGARASGRLCGRSEGPRDRKSTRLNSSHGSISYAVFCLKKKKKTHPRPVLEPNASQQHSRCPSRHMHDVAVMFVSCQDDATLSGDMVFFFFF